VEKDQFWPPQTNKASCLLRSPLPQLVDEEHEQGLPDRFDPLQDGKWTTDPEGLPNRQPSLKMAPQELSGGRMQADESTTD
jgi:hypothetical protein